METQKFIRRPFALEAVQVTPANIAEVAEWCGGTVAPADYKMMGGIHKMLQGCIMLPKQGPKNNKIHRVMIGHWITKHRSQFRNWTLETFESSFRAATENFKKNDLVKVLPGDDVKTWENWEGKVVDAVLVGVDFGTRGMVVFEPSQLARITEMDSLQLEFNAGVAMDPQAQIKNVLDEMREASKDRIAELEKENLEYDPREIREGDLVKVKKHPQLSQPSPYDGQCGHVSLIELVPSADGPAKNYWVEFATADPDNPERVPFDGGFLQKLRQDGEALNYEEPFDMAIPPAGAEERAVEVSKEMDVSYLEALKLVHESDQVTINQFREQLGMGPIRTNANGDELLSPAAIEHLRSLTTEDFIKFAKVQKIGEEDLEAEMASEVRPKFEVDEKVTVNHPISQFHNQHGVVDNVSDLEIRVRFGSTVAPFAPSELIKADFQVGNLIETLVEHEFDGVTIPVGTPGRITVLDVELPYDHRLGIEVLFADGHYNSFAPYELKKI